MSRGAGGRGLVLALALAGAAGCAGDSGMRAGGLVVDRVEPGYAAARAGLAAGDRIDVASLPELAALERRSEAGESVRVRRLAPSRSRLLLPACPWGIEARPVLAAAEAALHARALAAYRGGEAERAARSWRDLASRARGRGALEAAAFFDLQGARALLRLRRREDAGEAARRAFEIVAGRRPLESWARWTWGEALARASEHPDAHEVFGALQAVLPEHETLLRAALQHRRALALFRAGRAAEAEEAARRAVDQWEAVAPHSPTAADVLLLMARVERNRSRYDAAAALVERSLEAARASDPGGPAEAAALGELGVLANRLGRAEEEERRGREALALYERLGVRNAASASIEMGLGIAAYRRGDVARAEGRFRAALAAFESEAPLSLQVGWALLGLGHVQEARGDLEGALESYQRSARIREAVARGTPDHAVSLENLASVAARRGELELAEHAYREVLEMLSSSARETFTRARVLGGLAEVVAARGRLDEGRALLEDALRLHEARAPDGLDHAEALAALGDLERRAGRPGEAERAHRHALRIRSRLAPGSSLEAGSLYAVALLERAAGRREAAVATLRRAVEAIEIQRSRLGGAPEDRARFGAMWAHVHKELLDLLLEAGREEAAFDLLERYRVGALGALLSERERRVGPALPELLRGKREELAREYERVAASLQSLAGVAAQSREVDEKLSRLRALRAERARLLASAEEVPPELSVLESPRPPDREASLARLGDGVLLLSFAVLPRRTVVFALAGGRAGSLETHVVPLAEADLRERVEVLVDLLRSPHAPEEGRRALRERLAQLYRDLLGPLRRQVAGSRSLLVLPDGPLHYLPFGALRPDPEGSYLIETHTVARAHSLTLLAARAHEPPPGGGGLVAFGDPAAEADPRGGAPAAPLGYARAEVRDLERLFPGGARVFLGAEASEARAKALAGEARYLHFACHAEADDRFPLDSYLALAPSAGGDNGRLQAWEVYEELRLEAEVVALSACETAAGPELGGAGLLGLTYAFRSAGARAVLASLWPVSDRSTAALMSAFYAHLVSGLRADEALRRAQVDLIAAPLPGVGGWSAAVRRLLRRPGPADGSLDASHPYYWASFQLFGFVPASEGSAP